MVRPGPADRKNTVIRDMDRGMRPPDSVHADDVEQREASSADEFIGFSKERCAKIRRIEGLLRDDAVYGIEQGARPAQHVEFRALNVELAEVDIGYAGVVSP